MEKSDMGQSGPVFVVGMNGSGTTMLADSLGRHPCLYMLPLESKVIPYFIRHKNKYGDLGVPENRRRLADDLGKCKAYWQANGHNDVRVPDEYLANDGLPSVIDGLYRYFANQEGKVRWGDKSPVNTIHIGELASLFPDAQFIHIIRDGRDAAQSFHRRWGYDPLHTITRWKNTVLSGRRQGDVLGSLRYMEITYESLTNNPDVEMKNICNFLGLSFDQNVMQSSMRYMDPANLNANAGKIISNSGKWREYFNSRQVLKIESIAGRALADLGYSVTNLGDATPGKVRKIYWLIKDSFASTTSFFREYGLKAFPMYLRQIRDAAKQLVAGMQ